jgi:polysaccharide export outer membrane protein
MGKLKKAIGIAVMIFLLTPPGLRAQDTAAENRYLIGAGDVLEISVWKDPELTRTVIVLPDGRIGFPLIGELQAAGKTLTQLTGEIEQKLELFVPDVTLSIMISQVGSMHIYVIGRVNNPGRFVLNANVNVLQALAMAGGLNPFAKKGDIRIFRDEAGGETRIFEFDYDAVTKGETLKPNIRLKRGDVIVVP